MATLLFAATGKVCQRELQVKFVVGPVALWPTPVPSRAISAMSGTCFK